MRCPKCDGKLLQKTADGGTRLRTEGLHRFDADGNATAKCYWCKQEIPIPIRLLIEPSEEKPKLVISR